MFSFKPIGYVESSFKEKFGTPRQSGLVPASSACIKLSSGLNHETLDSLDQFSHLWILFVFHEHLNDPSPDKVSPPRLGGARVGVFASRSPHRPNPIGLSLVQLERIEGRHIYLSGVDFIEGTPILDIKPYLPETEARPEARHGWLDKTTHTLLAVEFSSEALSTLETLKKNSALKAQKLQALIQETLTQDPRPLSQKNDKQEFGCSLEGWNIRFKIEDSIATVLKIH